MVAILGSSLAQVHLPEVRRELGLLVSAACHVLMRADHFSPRGETARRMALNWSPRGPAPLRSRLLVEAHPQEFHLHALDLGGLRGGNGRQEPVRRIESAVGVVAGKCFLVRPAIPDLPQFAHQAPFGMSKGIPIDVIPGLPHNPQEPGDVQPGKVPFGVRDRLPKDLLQYR